MSLALHLHSASPSHRKDMRSPDTSSPYRVLCFVALPYQTPLNTHRARQNLTNPTGCGVRTNSKPLRITVLSLPHITITDTVATGPDYVKGNLPRRNPRISRERGSPRGSLFIPGCTRSTSERGQPGIFLNCNPLQYPLFREASPHS